MTAAGASWAQGEGADGGAPGPTLFDVSRAPGVQRAEAAVVQASDGLRALLPEALRRPSALGLELWQWVGLPVLAVVLAALTVLLARLTRVVLVRVASRTSTGADDRVVRSLEGPLKLWWAALLTRVAVPGLALGAGLEEALARAARIGLGVAFFWGLLRALTEWSDHFLSSEFAQSRPGSKALVGLFSRVGRVALVGLALLATLSELGYSVTSVLAGLGIGGIALALGAQKTLENVFGAFALAVDQPIREGDFVRVEDFVGTVENIGLRSTRIRTLGRTVVSIPNGKLADLRLETFAARERILLSLTVGLPYGTTAAQLEQVMAGFHRVLEAQPTLWPDSRTVRLAAFAPSSLDVEVMAWFVLTDYDAFKAVREQVLLGFMREVEAAGTSFAFPTRTVHLEMKNPLPGVPESGSR